MHASFRTAGTVDSRERPVLWKPVLWVWTPCAFCVLVWYLFSARPHRHDHERAPGLRPLAVLRAQTTQPRRQRHARRAATAWHHGLATRDGKRRRHVRRQLASGSRRRQDHRRSVLRHGHRARSRQQVGTACDWNRTQHVARNQGAPAVARSRRPPG